MKSSTLSLSRTDWVLLQTVRLATALAASVVGLIFIFLLVESLPLLINIGVRPFFNSSSWSPTEGLFNISPMVWGSLTVSLGALAFSFPVALGLAIFVRFYSPRWVSVLIDNLLEILGGVPSVVFGLWGLVIMVPALAQFYPPGTSLLAGALILSMMILPALAMSMISSLASIPSEIQMQCSSLGLSNFRAFKDVIWPTVSGSVFSNSLLQLGRALGETMAILMVCGNVVQTPTSIFDPIRTLTTNIALEMAYATGPHRYALFVSGLVLLIAVIALMALADKLQNPKVRK